MTKFLLASFVMIINVNLIGISRATGTTPELVPAVTSSESENIGDSWKTCYKVQEETAASDTPTDTAAASTGAKCRLKYINEGILQEIRNACASIRGEDVPTENQRDGAEMSTRFNPAQVASEIRSEHQEEPFLPQRVTHELYTGLGMEIYSEFVTSGGYDELIEKLQNGE